MDDSQKLEQQQNMKWDEVLDTGQKEESDVKTPSEENLKEAKLKLAIAEVKDVRDLYKVIDENGGLQGSQKFYSPEELNSIISRVANGADAKLLTSSYGLRQKVLDLVSLAKARGELKEQEKVGLPKGAKVFSDADWNINFIGDRAKKLEKMKVDFPNLKETGWKTENEAIDGRLLFTDGKDAIFQNDNGVKFIISYEKINS